MANLFFFLSGEHPDLPISELRAILETEGYPYPITEKLDQIARVEADPRCTEAIKRRAALTRLAAMELFNCEAKRTTIIKTLRQTRLDEVLNENESFVIRIKHVGIKEKIREKNFIHGSSLFNVALSRACGGYKIMTPNPGGRGLCEDWGNWIGMIEAGARVCHIPEPLLYYRKHRFNWGGI